jgi:CheY-like chemotaxis protein
MTVDYDKDTWKILVVDDVQVHRFLMTSGLGRINPCLQISEACNFSEATAMLSEGAFDVVVSDWNMPTGGGGGGELVKWMRARPHFCRVPFVMISGNAQNDDIISAFMELGVDAYVVKPFTAQDLYSKIKFAVEKRR